LTVASPTTQHGPFLSGGEIVMLSLLALIAALVCQADPARHSLPAKARTTQVFSPTGCTSPMCTDAFGLTCHVMEDTADPDDFPSAELDHGDNR
jgi:hypothetical protein